MWLQLRECLRGVRPVLDGRLLNESWDDAFQTQMLLSSVEVVCNGMMLEMGCACVVMGFQVLRGDQVCQDEINGRSYCPRFRGYVDLRNLRLAHRVHRQRTHCSRPLIPYSSASPLGISYRNKGTFSRILRFASRNCGGGGCIDDLSVPLPSPNIPPLPLQSAISHTSIADTTSDESHLQRRRL